MTVACENAVIVSGIELGLSECLPAAGRAPIEIGTRGSAAVELLNNGFRYDGHLVNRAIPIVFFFFHVRQPGPVARDVTGVCACSGVSGYDRIRQRSVIEIVRKIRIADYSAKPAVADALKLTVPVVRRHPYFDLDIRGGARFERRGDAAK